MLDIKYTNGCSVLSVLRVHFVGISASSKEIYRCGQTFETDVINYIPKGSINGP